jgi:AAA15 family ATPase/GTPase
MATYIGTDIPRHTKKLVRIGIKNFRPFKNWQYFYPAKLNLLIGPNNSGKTTFWEILSLLQGDNFPNVIRLDENHELLRENDISNYSFKQDSPLEVSFEIEYDFSDDLFDEEISIDQFLLSRKVEVKLSYDTSIKDFAVLREVLIRDTSDSSDIFSMQYEGDESRATLGWSNYYQKYLTLLGKTKYDVVEKKTGRKQEKIGFEIDDKKSKSKTTDKLPFVTKPIVETDLEPNVGLDFSIELLKQFSNLSVYYDPLVARDDSLQRGIKLDSLFGSKYPEYLRKSAVNEKMSDSPADFDYMHINDTLGFPGISEIRNFAGTLLDTNESVPNLFDMNGIADYSDFYLSNLRMLIRDISDFLPEIWNVSINRLAQKKVYEKKELTKVGLLKEKQTRVFSLEDPNSKWLQRFGIADKLQISEVIDGMYKFSLLRGKDYIPLYKLGYGSVQIINLLLARNVGLAPWLKSGYFFFKKTIWLGGNNRLIFLQEPESNLHPKLQSELADLFVDTVKNKLVSLIVETHSEFLLRKLQYLVAKGEIDANDISIHYFEEIKTNDNIGHIRRIEIRKDGMLKQKFGEGFFDESARWTFELLKIQNSN